MLAVSGNWLKPSGLKRTDLGIWRKPSSLGRGRGWRADCSHQQYPHFHALVYSEPEPHSLHVAFPVGEVADDGQRAQEDHILSDVSCHRHHLCGLVLICAHRPYCWGDQAGAGNRWELRLRSKCCTQALDSMLGVLGSESCSSHTVNIWVWGVGHQVGGTKHPFWMLLRLV